MATARPTSSVLTTAAVRRCSVAAATLWLVAGCSPAPRSPAQGGPVWRELTTDRFVLHTDLDEGAAHAAASEFEAASATLEQVAFPHEGSGPRLDIVVFRNELEFHHFWPRDMAGLYLDRPPEDVERAPTMVLHGTLAGGARIVFLHELTHRFMARSFGSAPVWMNEGLADYFSTMRVEGGQVVLGVVPAGRVIDPSLIPSVRELVTADREAFYGAWTGDDGEDLHRVRFYAGAYALVHMLRNGTDDQRRSYDAFVQAMNAGAPGDEAWARTLGTMPDDALERMFRAHLAGWREWDLFAAPARPVASPSHESVRTMSDAEVHLLWARLIRPSPGEGTREVQAQLDAALARAPASPEVAYWRGCFELGQWRAGAARELFQAALAQEPDNPRYLYAMLMARLRGGGHQATVLSLLDRLERVARSADELGAVALYESSRRDRDAAMRHAEAAVAADPGYAGAIAIRARVHFEAGELAAAVSDQERALALLPERVDDRSMVQALADYRRALSNAGGGGR
ncbi:MAG TPA: hypothetical protein VIF15_05550 [Polyangiaceae bacterium]